MVTLITDAFMTTVYVIDVAGTVAVAAWVIVVLATSTAERDNQ